MTDFTLTAKCIQFPEIIYSASTGADRHWSVKVELLVDGDPIDLKQSFIDKPDPKWCESNGYTARITTNAGQVGGKIRENTPTVVKVGKNIGKKNYTNCLTQAIKDANSLYNKQIKKSKPKEKTHPLPMRSVKREPTGGNKGKSAQVEFDGKTEYIVQRKLDGIRCVIGRDENDRVFAYSRKGIELTGYDNIIEDIKLLIEPVKGPIYIDGEMYAHGKHLNDISGKARKGDIEGLEFHVFDLFFPQDIDTMQMAERQDLLSDLFDQAYTKYGIPTGAADEEANTKLKYLAQVHNYIVLTEEDFNMHYKQFLSEGYEGAMIRRPTGAYKYSLSDRQSPDLIKVKPIEDSEFHVVDFLEGKKGKDVGAIIWVCEANNDKKTQFHVVPKNMTYPERKTLFEKASENTKVKNVVMTKFEAFMKGKLMTVEYPGLTKYGVPAQAKALHFRVQDTNEPDPIDLVLNSK